MIAGRQGLDREMVLQISPKIGGARLRIFL